MSVGPAAGGSAASDVPDEQTVRVEAADGVALAGTLVAPPSPTAALLVGGGTGIPRRFYGRFAQVAARHGFAVLTVDYRGIGGSAPPSLRGFTARYRDTGQRDLPGAIDWLSERYPDLPLAFVGHSVGGQQIGLAPNVGRIGAAVFVAVSTGYWRGMPTLYGLMTRALFATYRPLTSRLFGYVPAKRIGWGEDLPVDVAREWAAWCAEPDYLGAFASGRRPTPDGSPFGPVHFGDAAFPVRAYAFTDDPIGTRANVPPMLAFYTAADIETVWVDPADLGRGAVGHLGFFRQRVGGALWDGALDWLTARVS